MTPVPKLYLREWRTVRGFSLRQLEATTKIGRGMLSHYESGRRNPNMTTLDLLARGLKVTVAELFTGPTKTARPKRPRRTTR